MGDAGEGLIDNDARIQERIEEASRERRQRAGGPDTRDPRKTEALESLRLARTELARQLAATGNAHRRAQLSEAIAELDRRALDLGQP